MSSSATAHRPSEGATSLEFAAAARSIGRAAGEAGLIVPGFRTPPRRADADRTVRRVAGQSVVAVRLKGRPLPAVLADLIEGVIVVNDLDHRAALRARDRLWQAVTVGVAAA